MKSISNCIQIIFTTLLVLLISSCTEGFFDNLTGTSTETTGAMFWTASDLGVGSITVTCNGSTKTISSYYSSGDPNHGASGAANFTLNPGNYSYNASGGSLKWSGNIDVTKGVCTKMQLYGNSTGTGSLSLNGKWKDSVEFTIIISGTSGLINSFGSGNWKTAAEKGYVQIGSLFLKSISKSNSTNWTCENLAMTTTNGVINGTKWYSNSTITISTNGNSFTLYTTIGTNTFTRVN